MKTGEENCFFYRRRNKKCPGLGELGGALTQAIGASFWSEDEPSWSEEPPAIAVVRRQSKSNAVRSAARETYQDIWAAHAQVVATRIRLWIDERKKGVTSCVSGSYPEPYRAMPNYRPDGSS